jgi:SAM-dependent methyltransferase
VAVGRTMPGETRVDHARRRNGGFWGARTVAWCQRALARSDYATRVLAAITPQLAGTASVLDVGAGCGALALPLAERIPQVTALEPAPAMVAALRAEAGKRGFRHLTVVNAAWGEVALPPHDLVLCAQVGELTRSGAPFLGEAARWARRWVGGLGRAVCKAGRGAPVAGRGPRGLTGASPSRRQRRTRWTWTRS